MDKILAAIVALLFWLAEARLAPSPPVFSDCKGQILIRQ
jgi:hypothetical protein